MMPLSALQKKVARDSFIHRGSKKHECKKCGKLVNSDSVERWASHLRGYTLMSLLKQSPCCLPPRKTVALLLLMTVSSLIQDRPTALEPKRRARAGLYVADVTGK